MKDLYIVSKTRIIYMEDTKISWIYKVKNKIDRIESLKHLKECGARIDII